MVYSKRFPSGLRLVVKQMDGLLSVSMGVLVGTGSCFESEKENGISHFIEHMMFKGTQKRTAFEISDAMDRIGAQDGGFLFGLRLDDRVRANIQRCGFGHYNPFPSGILYAIAMPLSMH